jgi:hypothetical protein
MLARRETRHFFAWSSQPPIPQVGVPIFVRVATEAVLAVVAILTASGCQMLGEDLQWGSPAQNPPRSNAT